MREKLNDFMEKSVPFFIMAQFIFIAAYIIFMILPFPVMIFFYIFTPFLNFTTFIFYKDYVEEDRLIWNMLFIQVTLFIVSIPIYLMKLVEEATGSDLPIVLKIMLALVAFVFTFALIITNRGKIEDRLEDVSFRKTLERSALNTEDSHDIKLCFNKFTRKAIVLAMNMRFLHMLIIGPTGCGKTSQIILPMLLQDIRRGHGVIVLEPKSDLAIDGYSLSVLYNKGGLYFDPIDPDCPRFNPLEGDETSVATNLTTIFNMLNQDSPTYYKDLARELISKSIKVIKRIERAYVDVNTRISSRPATLLTLNDLLWNIGNRGRTMVNDLMKLPTLEDSEKKENEDIGRWFIDTYWNDNEPVHKNTSGIRSQVEALTENSYLRKVLNPVTGKSDINFTDIIENEKQIFITTHQGILGQDLSSFLGYFLMFSIQSAIFRRDINDTTLKPCYWYLDEFQTYANSGFGILLEQGRGYRVSAVLATQSQARIKPMSMGKAGDAFLTTVKTNARNKIIFPGIDVDDAKYFSDLFGKEEGTTIQKSVTTPVGLSGGNSSKTEREVEDEKERYTYSKLMYKKKKEITYRIIEDDTVQFPGDGKVDYIDKRINKKMKNHSREYINSMMNKTKQAEMERQKALDNLYSQYQKNVSFGYGSIGTKENNGPSIEGDDSGGFGSNPIDIE